MKQEEPVWSDLKLQNLGLLSSFGEDDMPADYHLNIGDLIKKAGFGFERHDVTTPDGYILGVMRVMNSAVRGG